ncbi:MAG: hypothetical protein Q9160_005467 [Pyrenula sp. 1 TL-2023]
MPPMKRILSGKLPYKLQFSADWAEGIEILIGAGADINVLDHYGQNPISWACFARNVAAVQLFLEAECNFWRAEKIMYTMVSVFDEAVCCEDNQIIKVVIENLYKRRERLKTIAQMHGIRVTDVRVIDEECFGVIQKLRKAGVQVPESLTVPYSTTVLHSSLSIRLCALRHLEASGFMLDVLVIDQWGLTPLAIAALRPWECNDLIHWISAKYLEVSRWKKDDWCSIVAATNRDNSVQWPAFSLLAYCCSYRLKSWERWRRCEGSSLQLFFQQHERFVFRQEATFFLHQCSCACNVDFDGCSTLLLSLRTVMLDAAMGRSELIEWITPARVFVSLINVGRVFGIRNLGEGSRAQLVRQITRLVCMTLLQIPHVCCKVRDILSLAKNYDGHGILYRWVEDEDIEAILEEHEGAISQLEALVDIFSTKENSASLGLSDVWLFLIDNFWASRATNKVTEEELSKIRSTGIVVYDQGASEDREVGDSEDLIFYGYNYDNGRFRHVYKTEEELRATALEFELEDPTPSEFFLHYCW